MTTHNDVAHNWAHQTGKARKGFNMFYDGPTLYSYGYHFPLATIIEDKQGRRVYLVNSAKASISTSKHQYYARRAIPQGATVYHVPNLRNLADWLHRVNHADLLKRATEAYEKASRARKYGQMHLDQAARLTAQANAYNEAFALGLPEAVADLTALREALAARAAESRRAEAERQAKQEADDREAIAKWQAGETERSPHTARPFVRVKGDTLETSWGIKVPMREALPIFRKAQECAETHTEFVPPEPVTVGGFRLTRIDAEGTITAGCHVIPLDRANAAAARAGLL